jgi:DNA-binding transcriptional regulator GbsR (MarR family)
MARKLQITNIKKVIDSLRSRNLTWAELNQRTGISETSLSRILTEYLQFWDLIKKVKDEDGLEKWAWVENIKDYGTIEEYKIDLKHSKEICPTLFTILVQDEHFGWNLRDKLKHDVEDFLQFQPFILQHLQTGYPDTYERVSKFRDMLKEAETLLETIVEEYKSQIVKPYDDRDPKQLPYLIDDWKKTFARSIDARLNLSKSTFLGFSETEAEFSFISDTHMEKAMSLQKVRYQHFEELFSEFNKLWLRVEHGRPLEGKCDLCPQICISENKKL